MDTSPGKIGGVVNDLLGVDLNQPDPRARHYERAADHPGPGRKQRNRQSAFGESGFARVGGGPANRKRAARLEDVCFAELPRSAGAGRLAWSKRNPVRVQKIERSSYERL